MTASTGLRITKRHPEYRPIFERWEADTNGGCWLWRGGTTAFGYGVAWINKKTYLAHRLFYEHFNSPIDAGLFVCHRCDVPACVNPAHLFLGTCQDNLSDMEKKGRRSGGSMKGVVHPNSKLDEEKVRTIRADKRSLVKIAKAYGVSPGLIHHIRHRKAWAHVS